MMYLDSKRTTSQVYSQEMTDSENIARYITGGRAIVALVNETPYHKQVTYKILSDGDFYDVSFWTAHSGWIWLAAFNKQLHIHEANKQAEKELKGLIYLLRVARGERAIAPMHLYHFGRCCICGRKLTTPKALTVGVGHKCWKDRFNVD